MNMKKENAPFAKISLITCATRLIKLIHYSEIRSKGPLKINRNVMHC